MKQHRTPTFLSHLGSVSRWWIPSVDQETSPVDTQTQLIALRREMLAALGESVQPALQARISLANADALWYLRPSLLVALSLRDGECKARERMDEISGLFDGLVPPALCRSAGRPQH